MYSHVPQNRNREVSKRTTLSRPEDPFQSPSTARRALLRAGPIKSRHLRGDHGHFGSLSGQGTRQIAQDLFSASDQRRIAPRHQGQFERTVVHLGSRQ